MWAADTATLAWSADDTVAMWAMPGWQSWPGQIVAERSRYLFRLTIGGGATQGVVSVFTFVLDAPDLSESLGDVAIAAAGTRLPLTLTYAAIKAVALTLQADAGTAVLARVEDKDAASGPLVKCYNSSGTAVDGTVDAIIQGY
jgi:hypothetical protein